MKFINLFLLAIFSFFILFISKPATAEEDVLLIGFVSTLDDNITRLNMYPQIYYLNGTYVHLGVDEMMRDESPKAQKSSKYRKMAYGLLKQFGEYSIYGKHGSQNGKLIGKFKTENIANTSNCYEDAVTPLAKGSFKGEEGLLNDGYALYSTKPRSFVPIVFESDPVVQGAILDFLIPIMKKEALAHKSWRATENIDKKIGKETIPAFIEEVDIDNLKSYINKFRLSKNGENWWMVHFTVPGFHFNYILRQTKKGYQVIDNLITQDGYSEEVILKTIDWILPYDQNKILMMVHEKGIDIHVKASVLYELRYDKKSDTYKKIEMTTIDNGEC